MNNPIEQIQMYYGEMTKTDREIAIYIINNPNAVITEGMNEIARKTKSSKSAVSRFAQKIGYSGFTEFAYDMGRFLISHDNAETPEENDPVRRISSTYANYINMIPEYVSKDQIDHLAMLFTQASVVKLFGINRSFNTASQFKQRLARIGFPNVMAEGDRVVITDYMNSSGKDNLIIIFSTTDNSKYFTSLFNDIKQIKSQIVFITCNPNLPFKKKCNEYIVLPRISKDSYATFLDDQALFMVFVEILIEAIVRNSSK
jgi:DNA-binding MurR/RpiR family transcriptional regulator